MTRKVLNTLAKGYENGSHRYQQMWGYGGTPQTTTGTLDALYALVLIREATDRRLGIVALDLGRAFGPHRLISSVL